MQGSGHIQTVTSSAIVPQQSVHHAGKEQSKVGNPEKRAEVKTLRLNEVNIVNECPDKDTIHDHRIDIGDC